ncbi:hypothetical protein [Amycolatopsis sp. NPDC051372]|uniref:hypothetical protein n=1 Tax=Amycolatopsis sp. NPDC051372 TaxID=3155669 RepID=UPI003449215E
MSSWGSPVPQSAVIMSSARLRAGEGTRAVCPEDRIGALEHVQVDGEVRRRGYGRVLALAVFSRLDWFTDGPDWMHGDRRVRALRAAQHGAGYTWTTMLIEDTPQARGFAEWLPLSKVGEPLYCRHMLDAAGLTSIDSPGA